MIKTATKTLSLNLETLVELTPEDAQSVNGGYQSLSSALPPAHGGVSSALPPKPAKKPHHPAHHGGVSSAKPF